VMRDRRYGRILYVGSAGGMFGCETMANYSAAKAGMYGLMRTVALEGKPIGITANYLLPGALTRLGEGSHLLTDELRRQLVVAAGPAIDPSFGIAASTFLLSSSCELTGRAFSSALGYFAEVFVGVTPGWHPPKSGKTPTPEEFADLLEQISDQAGYIVLQSAAEEMGWALGGEMISDPFAAASGLQESVRRV
jgi:NAD(P)-dependent dehydrogenase (short-subunit alcohol dehydrogenase family)